MEGLQFMKKVLCLIITLVIIFTGISIAYADQYSLNDPIYFWTNPGSVYWKLTNLTSNTSWSTWVSQGATAWTNAGTKIRMYKTTALTKGCDVYIGNYGNTGWDGSHSKNTLTEVSTILLNNSSSTARSNGAELAAHEFGHAHGLLDVQYRVLMIDSGYIGTPNPTIHDKEGINAAYGTP